MLAISAFLFFPRVSNASGEYTFLSNEIRAVNISNTFSFKVTVSHNMTENIPAEFDRIEVILREGLRYLESYGINTTQCKKLDLKVRYIEYENLNNRSLMSSLNWSSIGDTRLTGVYALEDPENPAGYGEIFISSNIEMNVIVATLRHELLHFLQDTTCSIDSNSELLATRFE